MEDNAIIDLFFKRDEQAVIEIKKKYSDDGSLNNGDRISIYIEGGVMPSQLFRLIYD